MQEAAEPAGSNPFCREAEFHSTSFPIFNISRALTLQRWSLETAIARTQREARGGFNLLEDPRAPRTYLKAKSRSGGKLIEQTAPATDWPELVDLEFVR